MGVATSSPTQRPAVGIVLSLLLASTLANPLSLEGTDTACLEQRGVGLGWVEPFAFCGVLAVIIEGLTGRPPNQYTATLNGNYMRACASGDQQQVYLKFEWCSNISAPSLMLPKYIQQLDIRVLKDHDEYKFYGCSVYYQTMFDIALYETSLHQLSCRSLMAYVGQRSEMPGTYQFYNPSNQGVLRSRVHFASVAILGCCWFVVLFTSCSLMYSTLTTKYATVHP